MCCCGLPGPPSAARHDANPRPCATAVAGLLWAPVKLGESAGRGSDDEGRPRPRQRAAFKGATAGPPPHASGQGPESTAAPDPAAASAKARVGPFDRTAARSLAVAVGAAFVGALSAGVG